MNWITDPITKRPSVALTLLVTASVLMIGGIVMECFTAVRSSHLLDEFFSASIGLYGGHMFVFRGSADVPQPEADATGDIHP